MPTQPLLQQVSDAVNATANDANTAFQYVQTTYPGDTQLQQLLQAVLTDLQPLISMSFQPGTKKSLTPVQSTK